MIKLKLSPKLKSRKFQLAVISGVVVFLNGAYDMGLDSKEVLAMAGIIITYILGEAQVDVARAKNVNYGTVTFDSIDERVK